MNSPQQQSEGRWEQTEREAPAAAETSGAELMQQVLEETAAVAGARRSLAPDEWDALLAVARRHAGQPLELSPIAQELVQALLASRFRGLMRDPEVWSRATLRIAETLWEDPPSRARFQAFWERLLQREAS
jgi:hypothetical protein